MTARRRALFHAAAAAALGAGAPAPAQQHLLFDAQLRERAGTIVAIDDRTVTFIDGAGVERTESRDNHAAILLRGAQPPPRAGGMLRLADGQRLAGSLAPDGRIGGPDTLLWAHPTLGAMAIPLDDVSSVHPHAPGAPAGRRAADTVILTNADRLDGFVESIAASIAIEVGGQLRELPVARVREVLLANPDRPPTGTMIWLRDGGILAADSLRTLTPGRLSARLRLLDAPREPTEAPPPESERGAWADLALADVSAISFDAARLVPLGALPPAAQRPGQGRRWSPPALVGDAEAAPLGAPDVELAGPMAVEWLLPPDAARLSMAAELPPAMWTWGDCELIIATDAGPLARHRLNAGAHEAVVNVPIPRGAGRLVITLDQGEHGPVQDHIVLRRPLLLVER